MMPRDKLMSDPSSVFEKPGDVVDNMELSREQKIDILTQWKQEVTLRLVAEEENMPGDPGNSDRLQELTDALIALEED
jgi:hypothetical protein